MVTTMVLFCLGNLLYAVLSVFGSAALAVMITARFIVGVSSASMALIRTYTSSSTTLKERTPVVSLTSAAQAVGFIIGPAIQTALAVAFSEDTSEATNSTNVLDAQEGGESVGGGVGIQWNMYTATGWISCCFGLLNLVLFLPCIFQEYNIAAKEAQFQKRAANDQTSKIPKPDYVSLVVVLSTFFVTILIYVLLESLMVPMCMDLYAWTDQKAITVVGIGLSIGAGLCLFSFIAIKFLTKIVDERIVLIAGVLGMAVSMIIFIPMGSSYPKIKNCTSIYTLASHGNETLGIADAFHLTSLPDIDIGNAKVMSNNPATTEGNALFRESFDNSPVGDRDSSTTSKSDVPPQIDTNTRSLRRQRRHVPHTGDCKDTGCPPEQEWCSYTPIIELSQLGIASAIAVMGYPFVLTISSVLYSKVLGPKPQGLWMGLLISTGGLSRVIGPIFVSYIYTELGTRWIFGILLCVMTFTLLMNIIMYKRMVPMNIFGKR
ncbi:Major facilitator superfamily domain-containing protein 8 [Chionoecetes opilio]|uniref:Major facilitator superfamily domain-containing protein 8 n=1 Tax=Chionoecetes opilio TaxID=41210 RepID=A0A8J5CLZ6_CHIOP|nr:Major facilitator superfamily domain-containing protein 8 [Chionoecetes opilio]